MYAYSQKTDNKYETWTEWSGDDLEKMKAESAHVSVYTQSQARPKDQDNQLDYSQVTLCGDLIIDIDADDIDTAIVWLNRLMDQLEKVYEVDLDSCEWYASGSKGFHIVIPQSMISSTKGVLYLNKIHRIIAAKLAQDADIKIDMGLYYTLHLIRVANKKRADGRYKVRLTPHECKSITKDKYYEYVSAPRIGVKFPKPDIVKPNSHLADLWKHADIAVKDEVTRASKYPTISSEHLSVFSDEVIPACITWAINQNNLKKEVSFNVLKMNMATFLAYAEGVSDGKKDILLDAFAENTASDKYATKAKRTAAVRETINYANTGSLKFSCASNRSILAKNPCEGCPLKSAKDAASAIDTAIEKRSDGYFAIGPKGEALRLTNFVLTREQKVFSLEYGQKIFRGEVLDVTLCRGDIHKSTRINMPASNWTSLSRWKESMMEADGTCFITNESILPRLKTLLDQDINQGEEMLKVDKAGINILREEDTEYRFWAEPDWSMTGHGCVGKYAYGGNAGDTLLRMHGVETAKPEDEGVVEVLRRLLHSNKPSTVAICFGWAMATYFKEHLAHTGWTEFPLLHIAGIPGSGKTMTATVYATLTGSRLSAGPMDVANTTAFPVKQALSATTTAARVFDEFNRTAMPFTKYGAIQGFLRAAYCRQDIATGTLAKGKYGQVGGETIHQIASAPVIYLSKEATENEELIQRSIIIRIDKKDHLLGDYTSNFEYVRRTLSDTTADGHPLQKIVKLLLKHVLEVPTEEVSNTYNTLRKSLPRTWHSRLVNNVAVLKLGFMLAKEVFREFPQDIPARIDELDRVLIEYMMAEEEEITKRSIEYGTIEIVLETLGIMAYQTKSSSSKLEPGTHYVREKDALYIKPAVVYGPYNIYCRDTGTQRECSSWTSMSRLLKEAEYCILDGALPTNPESRGWLGFDLTQLMAKGVDCDGFV